MSNEMVETMLERNEEGQVQVNVETARMVFHVAAANCQHYTNPETDVEMTTVALAASLGFAIGAGCMTREDVLAQRDAMNEVINKMIGMGMDENTNFPRLN